MTQIFASLTPWQRTRVEHRFTRLRREGLDESDALSQAVADEATAVAANMRPKASAPRPASLSAKREDR